MMKLFMLALVCVMVALASAQSNSNGGLAASLPGGQTAAAALASSVDGMSRYLAPDGPIQPGITAVMGLPVRGGELVNNGITRISSGLNSGAQSLSRSAGQNGQIAMPGMASLRQNMPSPMASLGQGMQSMIRSKNNFIRGQAESGVESANRLGSMMRQGLQANM